jgi:hypothetical protein
VGRVVTMTGPQIERLAMLPDDYTVVGERIGSPVVERPDGRQVCVQPNGRLATTTLVLTAQSYLQVARC